MTLASVLLALLQIVAVVTVALLVFAGYLLYTQQTKLICKPCVIYISPCRLF
jgi:hypothetical protein